MKNQKLIFVKVGKIMKWDYRSDSKIIYFYLFSSIVVTITPERIFENIKPLNTLFATLIQFLPAFAMFKKYSLFPEVSMVAYLSDIVFFLFFLLLPLYRRYKIPDERCLEWEKRPIFFFITVPIILIVIMLGVFFFFPGTPGTAGGATGFIDHVVYNSKIGFVVGTTTMLAAQFISFILFLNFITCTINLIAKPKRR